VRENAAYRSMTEISGPKPLVGNGPAMAEVRKQIELVAKSKRDGAHPRGERHRQGSGCPRNSQRQ